MNIWPFKKSIKAPFFDGSKREVKSLSLPAALPRWQLFSRWQQGWNVENAIEFGYVDSAIVYACVEKRAKLIASVPWVVMRKKGNEAEPYPESPLQALIDRPNPQDSTYELMYSISQSLDLSGNAFVSEIRAGMDNTAKQIWCLPAKYMKIKPGSIRLVDYYEYQGSGVVGRKISPADMIQIKMPNPGDPLFGMPVLRAASKPTDIDRESAVWQKVSLENRGSADINIKMPSEATQEQVNNAKAQYKEMQTGASNARKALITNADIQQLGQTAVELDFVNSRRAVWTEICAVFGMSLANLGMTEAVNLANAQAMDKALWQNTIIPQLELIKRALNHQLAIDFGADVILDYDLGNVEALQENRTEKMASCVALFGMGVPFNDINNRLELGFDDIEGGDVGYISAGLLPVGFDPSIVAEPTTEESSSLQKTAYGDK